MFIYSLCLSGGGIAGFAHIGMLQYLYEKKLLVKLDTIFGTSIGTVVALCYGMGMKPLEIFEAMLTLDQRLIRYSDIDNFFSKYGFESGEYFIAHIIDMMIKKNFSPLVTFKQFHENTKIRLVFTGCNLEEHCTTYFSCDETPDMKVLDAVRISISIPFLLSSVRYKDNIHVDGGLLDNYPINSCIDDFESRYPISNKKDHVLGCCIEGLKPKKIQSMEGFIYNILACLIKKDRKTIQNMPCTIYLPLTDVSSIDFNMGPVERKKLLKMGYDAAKLYTHSDNVKRGKNLKRRRSAVF